MFTGRYGTGLVVAKLSDGTWSPPSAITISGMGWGLQIGAELTEVLLILSTDAAVDAFKSRAQVAVGAELGVSVGPVGRSLASDVTAGNKGAAHAFSYAHSKGLFFGASLEASGIATRPDVNRRFYGQKISPSVLLSGEYPRPRGKLTPHIIHVTSHHITSHHITSLISHHITSLMSHHLCHITSHHIAYVISHHITSHHLCHITSHHITYVTSHHTTSHHITSHHITYATSLMSHHIISLMSHHLCHITSHRLCHITSHHITSLMSHHITSHHLCHITYVTSNHITSLMSQRSV